MGELEPSWRSIQEGPHVILLRGIRALIPAAYESFYRRTRAQTLGDRCVDYLQRFSAFAFSAVMHILVLVLLAEFIYLAAPVIQETVLTAQLHKPSAIADVPSPDPVSKKEEQKFERAAEAPKVAEEPAPPQVPAAPVIGSGASEANARPVPLGVLENPVPIPESDLAHLTGTGLFGERGESGRQAAVGRYGGNAASEAAVELGLKWLAAHQSPDGRWSAGNFDSMCPAGDRCGPHAGMEGSDAGVTGLALLAFLGAGYSHQGGKYKETVERGLRFLLRRQDLKGFFFDSNGNTTSKEMYGNGVCAFALGEAAALTGDENLKEAMTRAVSAIAESQLQAGGWAYLPDSNDKNTELTLSIWQMMGLKAAEKAGVVVPQRTIERAKMFIRNSTDISGGVYYGRRSHITLGCTAAGAFARCIYGMPDGDALERALAYLDGAAGNVDPVMGRHASYEYIYYWYYRTLFTFQLQGRAWRDWNRKIRPYLVSAQRTRGHSAGSFALIDYKQGGLVYSTALCVMMLETYYRYLPMVSDRSALQEAVINIASSKPDEMTGEELRRADQAKPPPPEVLEERRKKDLEEARQKIKSEKPEERYIAARKLAEVGEREALENMIAAAEREIGRLRGAHIVFIGRLKDPKSIPWLMRQLDTTDGDVIAATVSALTNVTGVYNVDPARWRDWYRDHQKRLGSSK